EAVLFRVLGDEDHRQDIRNVIAGLLWDQTARIDLPEIRVPRTGDRGIDAALAGVVSRHRQLPVAVIPVGQPFQVTGRRSRGLFKARTFVDVIVLAQSVAGAGLRNELPQTYRRGPRTGDRRPGALNLAQPGDVLRDALFLENLLRQLDKAARASQSLLHRLTPTAQVVIDEALDQSVRLELEIELHRRDHRLHLIFGDPLRLLFGQTEFRKLVKRRR